MPRLWSDDDGALLIRWAGMAGQLISDNVPEDVVAANLSAQMREDMGDRDVAGIRYIVEQFALAVQEAMAAD